MCSPLNGLFVLPRQPFQAPRAARHLSPPSSPSPTPFPQETEEQSELSLRDSACSAPFAMDAAEVRRSSASSSPEFEFWPLHPDPAASPSCADELFAGGVLLPLPVLPPKPASSHSSRSSGAPPPEPEPEAEPAGEASLLATVAPPSASITSPAQPASTGGSKRWTDIFSKKPSPPAEDKENREKEKRKDGGGGGRKQAAHAAGGGSELNINIWPFSRSRSAGGGGGSGSSTKPRPPARKVSSAPCSRSNSRGEAGGGPPRRWAASPGRAGGGVPVGRSSPVWQIRRPATRPAPALSASELAFADRRAAPPQTHKEKSGATAGAGAGRKPGLGGGVRGLNLSVNSCIGYRHQVSCRRADVGAARGHGGGLFGIKGFFSKKVH
ncbi:unnamed protein product [Urochloa decumbens]|uniref:Uncharacterized protein n=1 Tax=Urochloa decumbens TaxID=240449 RepID=A0ABC9B488_9POAL